MGMKDFISNNVSGGEISNSDINSANIANIDPSGNLANFIAQNAVSLDDFGDGIKFTLNNGTGYIIIDDVAIRFHVLYDMETLSSFEPIKFTQESMASGAFTAELMDEMSKNPSGIADITEAGAALYREKISVEEVAVNHEFFEAAHSLIGNGCLDAYKFVGDFDNGVSVERGTDGGMSIVINMKETSHDASENGEDKQLIISMSSDRIVLLDSKEGVVMSCQASEVDMFFDKTKDIIGDYQLEATGRDKIADRLLELSEQRENMSETEYHTEILKILKDMPGASFTQCEFERFKETLEKLEMPSMDEYREQRALAGNPVPDTNYGELIKLGDSVIAVDLIDNLANDSESASCAAGFGSILADKFLESVGESAADNDNGFSLDDN